MVIINRLCDTQLAERDISHVIIGPLIKHSLYNCYTVNFVWCLKVTEAYNCNLINRNGFYIPRLVRNDILQLNMWFLGKKIFCLKGVGGHLGFLWFSAKLKTGEPHKSIFYLNALKSRSNGRPVDQILTFVRLFWLNLRHFHPLDTFNMLLAVLLTNFPKIFSLMPICSR